MANCVQCKKDITKEFYVKELNGYMCATCYKHYLLYKKAELTNKINTYKNKIFDNENEIHSIDEKIEELKASECKHENVKSTGMMIPASEGRMMKEFTCLDCGKTVYRQKLSAEQIKEKMSK